MSGFVGVLHTDGAPVNRALLSRMTAHLAYRGPDRQGMWIGGPLGFGHALLRTSPESYAERQPCSLDGSVWIVGDVRVDGRADLARRLHIRGLRARDVPDIELVLRAYEKWGAECVDHLLGDFAFAIWDSRARRLFCARDRFGVKLCYYCRVGDVLVFSNTLDCVRLHPAVSGRLNDVAIGDFLLFGCNQNVATTSFAHIQRLAPAHVMQWSAGHLRSSRYWSLPTGPEVRYARSTEYVEHFRELLSAAVQDRLRTDCIGVYMSGGVDSPLVAATARRLLADSGRAPDLRAHTVGWGRLIPDREPFFAGVVARALGISIHYLAGDRHGVFHGGDAPEMYRPEPWDDPLLSLSVDLMRQASAFSRVVLTGFDGDALLGASFPTHTWNLMRGLDLGRLLWETRWYLASQRRLPPLGLSRMLRLTGRMRGRGPYPPWVNAAFERQTELRARWRHSAAGLQESAPGVRAARAPAYRMLASPLWSWLFESYDPGVTRIPLEARHPLTDVRLVEFALALPPVPWCVDKHLLREAAAGGLPEAVRRRPKSPLPCDPVSAWLRQRQPFTVFPTAPPAAADRYIDWQAVPAPGSGPDATAVWMNLRPFILGRWLEQLDRPSASRPDTDAVAILESVHEATSPR